MKQINDDIKKSNLMVGIIVPVYKVEKFINECIDSIIGQTYENWQLILVDDGSPDNSGKICDEYAKNDLRIKVVHKKNGGLVSAWVRGIKELPENIDYITFVDSDDWLTKDFIEELVRKQKENQAEIIVSRLCGVYPDGRTSLEPFPVKVKFYDRLALENELFPVLLYGGDFHKRGVPCSRCGKLIKKNLMISNLQYVSEATTYGEDLNITFPMFLDASSVDLIEDMKCLYMVRKNPDSMTRAYDKNMLYSINYVYNSLFKIINDKEQKGLFENQVLADYLAASVQYYKNELLNPLGLQECRENIETYISRNDRLQKAIAVTEWRHYRKLNVIIINVLKRYNWFNKVIMTEILRILKKYRTSEMKRMN